MSQIGNIYNSYGHEFNIAVANTTSENVLTAITLPPDMIIISTETNIETDEDTGKFSMIATDYEGTPVRLTYCMKEGNGLYSYNDVMSMHIDGVTIVESDSMTIDPEELSFDDTIDKNQNGYIGINVDALPKASAKKFGTVKVDGFTVRASKEKISVDTSSLDLASGQMPGICIGDGSTIIANSGKVDVPVDNLIKCSDSSFGVFKVDDSSISSKEGVISLNQTYLISDSHIGLVKPDARTIISADGTLQINGNGLTKASNVSAGTVILGDEFGKNNAGQIYLKESISMTSYIDSLNSRISKINSDLDILEGELSV